MWYMQYGCLNYFNSISSTQQQQRQQQPPQPQPQPHHQALPIIGGGRVRHALVGGNGTGLKLKQKKEKSNLSSNSSGSGGGSGENSFIFTGYYDTREQPKFERQQQQQQPKMNPPQIVLNRDNNLVTKASTLYPKPMSKSSKLNKRQMYQKFHMQKRAEHDFYQLQAHIRYTDEIIARNPHLYSYYYSWMKQAQHALKQYMNVIEAPDNVSFSSVFGYSKDEEVQTIYRHPVYEMELVKSGNFNKTNNNHVPKEIDWKKNSSTFLNYTNTNECDSLSKTSSPKPSSSTHSSPDIAKTPTREHERTNHHYNYKYYYYM